MKEHGKFDISPRNATILLGFIVSGAAVFAMWFVKQFGRRTIIIWGHFAMSIVLALTGIFNNLQYDSWVLAMIILYLSIYVNTSGPIAWVYATETTIDTALGACLFVLWGTTFFVSLVSPILMGDDYLGVSNVFFLFSILSFGGSTYGFFFIKETYGLSDKEKKSLYYPKEY